MPIRPVRPSPVTADGTQRPVLDDRRQLAALQAWSAAESQVLPGDMLASPKTDRQQFRLGAGDYKPVGPESTVRVDTIGSGAGTVIVPDQVIATPFAFYQGVRFLGTITVPATSVLMLSGCEITDEVIIASGAKVHAIGCLFSGLGFLNNAGAIANVYVNGCHKTSTPAHVNVTIIAQT
jgi:hypothetical protein